MILGISFETFTDIHVVISLIAIAAGLIALYGMLNSQRMPLLTAIFLWMTVLTCVTGFPLPPFGFDPPRAIGILCLILLALALAGLYVFRLRGIWRPVYVITAVASLYLNVFVLVVQIFLKIPAVNAFAPTQAEPPFAITHGIVLLVFVVLGFLALRKFHPRGIR